MNVVVISVVCGWLLRLQILLGLRDVNLSVICWNCLFLFQGAKLSNANLKGANLQRAYLRHVNLRETVSTYETIAHCDFIRLLQILYRQLRPLSGEVHNRGNIK